MVGEKMNQFKDKVRISEIPKLEATEKSSEHIFGLDNCVIV